MLDRQLVKELNEDYSDLERYGYEQSESNPYNENVHELDNPYLNEYGSEEQW